MAYEVKMSLLMSSKNAIKKFFMQNKEINVNFFTDFPCGKIKSTSLLPDTVCGAEICDKAMLCEDCHVLFKAIEKTPNAIINKTAHCIAASNEPQKPVQNQLKEYINEYDKLRDLIKEAKFNNKDEYQAHQEQLRKMSFFERVIPLIIKCIESKVAKNLNITALEKLLDSVEVGLFEQLNFNDKLPEEFAHQNLIGAATVGKNIAVSIYFKNDDTYSRMRLIHQNNPGIEKKFKLFAIKSDLLSVVPKQQLSEFVPKHGTLVAKEMVDISGYSLCRYHPSCDILSISRANGVFVKELSENGLKLIYHAINSGVSNTQLLLLFDGLGFTEIKIPRAITLTHRNGERERLTF